MIDINELTLGQIKQLRAILNAEPIPDARESGATNGDPAPGTYVIVRCRDAGVHAGEFVSHPTDRTVVLRNSRRLWHWEGAASLSEIAVYGAKDVAACKFGVVIPNNTSLLDACEIIVCQNAGMGMIVKCPEWRA
jgi:hypothetical protein